MCLNSADAVNFFSEQRVSDDRPPKCVSAWLKLLSIPPLPINYQSFTPMFSKLRKGVSPSLLNQLVHQSMLSSVYYRIMHLFSIAHPCLKLIEQALVL
jgi:hypothetical protein